MSGRRSMLVSCAALLGLVASSLDGSTASAAHSTTGLWYSNERVCAAPAAGYAACDAVRHVAGGSSGTDRGPGPKVPPVSYGAAQLQNAYGLTSAAASMGANSTVAIVDAYDDPNAFSDLNTYRNHEGLEAIGSCTVSDGHLSGTAPCFAKVNQDGVQGSYPTANRGWAEEISLDLDMVSAICPKCDILLVEADSNFFSDLGESVNTAVGFAPVAIGNSYGGSEFSEESSYASTYYDHAGVAITASTGDEGYGAEFPAAASSVIGVGGTSLRQSTTAARGWSETVWSGTGSGCSAYVGKPSWQKDGGCTNRTIGDVAADADPNTGVKVYDTYADPGWLVFGGTSVSAQIIAGVYGLVGGGASDAEGLYLNGSTPISFGGTNVNLNDVKSGSDGSCTGHGRFADPSLAYLCTATIGYDGPTGMGTPSGTGAF